MKKSILAMLVPISIILLSVLFDIYRTPKNNDNAFLNRLTIKDRQLLTETNYDTVFVKSTYHKVLYYNDFFVTNNFVVALKNNKVVFNKQINSTKRTY